MNSLWIDKYKPNTLSDFIERDKEIKIIKDWLHCFKTKTINPGFKNGLLITGRSGVGKSSLIQQIVTDLGFSIIRFDSSTIDSTNIIETKIINVLSSKNILSYMTNIRKTCIIIDELDEIDSKKEFGSSNIIQFLSFNKSKFYAGKKTKKSQQTFIINNSPIICISNGKYSNKIKKECLFLHINPPNDNSIHRLVNKISLDEEIFLSELIISLIIKISQNDYRQTIIILEDITFYIKNHGYDNVKIKEKIKSLANKDADESLYTYTNESITEPKSHGDLETIYQKYNKSFIFINHRNAINIIEKCCLGNYKKKLEILMEYYKYFIDSNIFLKKSFNHWYLQKYVVLGTKSLNILFKQHKKRSLIIPYLEHSLILSKYNYRFYNIKAINRLSKKLDMDIRNFYIFSYFLYNILFNKSEQELKMYIKVLKRLDFDSTEFFKVIKLSILPETISLTKKLENKIKKIFIKI